MAVREKTTDCARSALNSSGPVTRVAQSKDIEVKYVRHQSGSFPVRHRRAAIAIAALLFFSAGIAVLSGEQQWRLRAIKTKLVSPEDTWLERASWAELLRIARPGSGFSVKWEWPMRINNPYAAAGEKERGKSLFLKSCSVCHGADAHGTAHGPTLTGSGLRWAHDELSFFQTIRKGIRGTSMPAHEELSWSDLWRLTAYVQSVRADEMPDREVAIRNEVLVKPDDLANASDRPEDWLTYSGTYNGWRFSGLRTLSRANASQLGVRWIHQLGGGGGRQLTSPLVYKGVMFLTAPPAKLLAIDASSGKLLWKHEHQIPEGVVSCCGIVNRGAAILGNQVFFTTIDAILIALDAATGRVNWRRKIADHRLDYSSTGAPLAVNDLIVTGVAGAEYATRGFLAAYRASDGELAWKFDTIPGPGAPGHESWGGTDSWKTGGGSTWMTGSFDPGSNTLYWGTGNPAPSYAGDVRPGDNLYTSSVVALDASTGALRWHFQFTPHDTHDWDSCQVPVLIDGTAPGQGKSLAWANRNGFFYSLDARSGKFLQGQAFARQTWAEGLDSAGRPIRKSGVEPSAEGTSVWPAPQGATNWWPPAYDPGAGLLFVPVIERPGIYFTEAGAKPRTGSPYWGGSFVEGKRPYTAVRALNARTGLKVWEQRGAEDADEIGGLLATAGGLLFATAGNELRALDSRTGDVLWSFDTGATIIAPPISYSVAGEQYVAVAAGNLMLAFSLPVRNPRPAANSANK